jgi:hypothetical protein
MRPFLRPFLDVIVDKINSKFKMKATFHTAAPSSSPRDTHIYCVLPSQATWPKWGQMGRCVRLPIEPIKNAPGSSVSWGGLATI